jgi:PAS domain S-box-containing protein
MLKYLKQNKNVIVAAFTLFIVSMSAIIFFLGSDHELKKNEYKAQVIADQHSPEQLEEKYRVLSHNEKNPFLVLSTDGTIEFVSPDFEKATGFKQDELKHQLYLLFINSEDLSIFLGAFAKILESAETLNMIGPYRFREKSGEYHFQMGSAVPVLKKEGRIEYIILIIKDIGTNLPANQEGKKKIRNQDSENDRLMAEKIRG